MLLSSLNVPLKEKSHDSSEAANAAFRNDSKTLVSHHASLQTAEHLKTKMMLCRTSAGQDDLAAIQDATAEPSDVDFFEDISGRSRRQAMALASAGKNFHDRPDRPGSPPRKYRRQAAQHFDEQQTGLVQNHGPEGGRPWNGEAEESGEDIADEVPEPWEETKTKGKGKGKGVVAKSVKGATTATKQIISKAEDALNKYREAFTDHKLWELKVKSRAVETMSTALSRHASQIMGLNSQDSEIQELAAQCVDFGDGVADKVKLIQTIRQAPEQCVKCLDESQCAIALKLDPSVLSAITAWVAGQTIKDMDQDGQGALPYHFFQAHS